MSDLTREQKQQQIGEIEALLPRAEAALRRYPNVVSVTVGAKEVRGVATEELAFQVYVRVKKGLAELRPEDRIPAQVLGFPTDVILIEEISPTGDSDSYRPLLGGTQLQDGGTLGIIALATAGSRAPTGAPVILTNSHVAPKENSLVGQPSSPSECWCCACCDVGKVVHSTITGLVDAAIATLGEGMRYSHEIVDVGAVRGWVSATTMVPGDKVFKRGRTTRLTEGRFSTASAAVTRDDGHAFTNQIRVTSPPPVPPSTTPAPFQLGGDSGSVLLDAQHRVIGLMHGAVLPGGTPAIASRIENIIAALHIDIPVMGTAGAVPLSGAVTGGAPEELMRQLEALLTRYGSRDGSRQLWQLVERHRDEVTCMVRTHRPTMLAWQRCQGPAFLSHYMKTVKDDGYFAPEEIGGMRVENLVLSMAAALQRHGSAGLSRAISRHYLQVLEVAHGCRRVEAFVDGITAAASSGLLVGAGEEPDAE